jgi:hypothetical protein
MTHANNYSLLCEASRRTLLCSNPAGGKYSFPITSAYRLEDMVKRLRINSTSFLVRIFVGLSFLLSADFCVAQPPVSYKVIFPTPGYLEEALNKHAKEGWRFKSATPWECRTEPQPELGLTQGTYQCFLLVLEKQDIQRPPP